MLLSNKWLKTGSGYEDWRDFFTSLGNWNNNYDFTYQEKVLNDQNKMLLFFLADDTGYNESAELWNRWDEDDERKAFATQALDLGLDLPKRFLNLLKK